MVDLSISCSFFVYELLSGFNSEFHYQIGNNFFFIGNGISAIELDTMGNYSSVGFTLGSWQGLYQMFDVL